MVARSLIASLLGLAFFAATASAQNFPDKPTTPIYASGKAPAVRAIKAGEFLVDPPTLINLGFEWVVSGDDNHNAKVDVSYRKKGETAWKPAMPLMRLYHERKIGRAHV